MSAQTRPIEAFDAKPHMLRRRNWEESVPEEAGSAPYLRLRPALRGSSGNLSSLGEFVTRGQTASIEQMLGGEEKAPARHFAVLTGSTLQGVEAAYVDWETSIAEFESLPANSSNFMSVLAELRDTTVAATGYFEVLGVGHLTLLDPDDFRYEVSAESTNPDASELANRIATEKSIENVDKESIDVAQAALKDALELVQRSGLGGDPQVMFSEDGILTLQWQRGEYGVALLFAGDGEVSVVFKRPGQFYAENGIEVPISEGVPREFSEALAAINN